MVSKYWCAILRGVSFVILFFTLEETNFNRDQVQSTDSSILSAEKSSLKVETETSTTKVETTRGAEHEILTDNPPSDLETKTEFLKKSYPQKLKLFDGKAFAIPTEFLA